jgi:membrane protease YdiL (CAAX protease family)
MDEIEAEAVQPLPEPPPLQPELAPPGPPEDPPSPPWDVLDLVFTLTVIIGSLFLVGVGGMLLTTIYSMMTYSIASGPQAHASDAAKMLTSDARLLLPVQLLADIIVVAFVFLTARVKYKRGFLDAIQWREPGWNAGLFVAAGVVLAIAAQFLPMLFPSNREFPIEKLFKDPVSAYMLAFFGIAIAPFFEEMLFRGLVYPVIDRRWGMEAAVLGSAALFASIHAPQLDGGLPQLGAIFLVGVALGYARGRTGSLAPGFWMHTSYNATLFGAIFAATHGFGRMPS